MAAGGIWFSLVYVLIGRIISSEGAHNLAALGLGHRFETAAYTIAQVGRLPPRARRDSPQC